MVEEHRKELGLGIHQVFFNTDLYGHASGTYKSYVGQGASSIQIRAE